MDNDIPFNYIITIHNKEEILDQVLAGVAASAGSAARIIPVLDGCNDGSESIARHFAANSGIETRIVTAPDVHEIKSINIGLREAKPGYCVVLQDDVILQEPLLEDKVYSLCEEYRQRLGYISFRLAADVRSTDLLRRLRLVPKWGLVALSPMVKDYNHVGSPQEELDVRRVNYGEFHTRMVGIKSPICLTPELRACAPYLDEDFAPYCYDDVDMSLCALEHGLINGLFPIKFRSESEWGGTRKDPEYSSTKGAGIFLRNRRLIWRKHGAFIQNWLQHQVAPTKEI